MTELTREDWMRDRPNIVERMEKIGRADANGEWSLTDAAAADFRAMNETMPGMDWLADAQASLTASAKMLSANDEKFQTGAKGK
jgi:hypothetical protein